MENIAVNLTPLASGWSAPDYAINEWKLSSTNPDLIDPASRREIISFGKSATNHNGGTIAFGPDGYLYLGLGDGGNGNDCGTTHTFTLPSGNEPHRFIRYFLTIP